MWLLKLFLRLTNSQIRENVDEEVNFCSFKLQWTGPNEINTLNRKIQNAISSS